MSASAVKVIESVRSVCDCLSVCYYSPMVMKLSMVIGFAVLSDECWSWSEIKSQGHRSQKGSCIQCET